MYAFLNQNKSIYLLNDFKVSPNFALIVLPHTFPNTLCNLLPRLFAINQFSMFKIPGHCIFLMYLYATLRYDMLRYATLRYSPLRSATLRSATLRYGPLRYATLHYVIYVWYVLFCNAMLYICVYGCTLHLTSRRFFSSSLQSCFKVFFWLQMRLSRRKNHSVLWTLLLIMQESVANQTTSGRALWTSMW